MASPRQQRRITFTGHVQGVGFRYTTQNLASNYDVSGYVKNLSNGNVELVAEGTPQELDAFLAEVRRNLGNHIHDEKSDQRAATGQYQEFLIQH